VIDREEHKVLSANSLSDQASLVKGRIDFRWQREKRREKES
jgi:hypothetical protein